MTLILAASSACTAPVVLSDFAFAAPLALAPAPLPIMSVATPILAPAPLAVLPVAAPIASFGLLL